MVTNKTLLLQTEEDFKKNSLKLKRFLQKASALSFWKAHFKKTDFIIETKGLSFKYWQTIPFSSIDDFMDGGLESRLFDAIALIQRKTKHFILRSPYGSRLQNSLILDTIAKQRINKLKSQNRIQIMESFGANLQQVLSSFQLTKGDFFLLVMNSQSLDGRLQQLFSSIQADSLFTEPKTLAKLLETLSDKATLKSIKQTVLLKPFGDYTEETRAKKELSNSLFRILPPFLGTASAIRSCKYTEGSFGNKAVHPRKYALIEIINSDEKGQGEIIVTTIKPMEMALIRYKSGVFGTAVFKKCKCGASTTLILGRFKTQRFYIAETDKHKYNGFSSND